MGEFLFKKITNPKRLILWVNREVSKLSNKNQRAKDYEFLAKPFNKGSKIVKATIDEMIEGYRKYIERHGKDSLYPIYSGMTVKELTFLYDIIKKLQPEVCVETGVANGFSTAIILLALSENKRGRLYSIDICYKPTGILIPKKLKPRWVLIKGFIKPKLKELINNLQEVDFFLHDGAHSYKDMLFDYNTIWNKMRNNSILISDDVNYNDAFIDFSETNNQKPKIFKMDNKFMGMIIKKIN